MPLSFAFHITWRPPAAVFRACVSLTAIMVAFCAYRLGIVPFIEPSMERDKPPIPGPPEERATINPLDEQARQLAMWFKPGDWELKRPKMLENSKGKLLLQDYRNLGDGRVHIRPCTMIFLPEEDGRDEEERLRQALILQSPEGATLQFDQPFDLRRGSVGRLVSGKLVGPITIRSDHRLPGPADDILIETRDLDVRPDLIATPNAIKFRYGNTRGGGVGMRIELTPAESDRDTFGPQVTGIRTFSLTRDVQVRMPMGADSLTGKQAARPTHRIPALFAPGQQSPVEVSCRGAFHFDLEKQFCTFQDHVDVLRVRPNGPGDQMACQTLTIFFEPSAAPASKKQPKSAPAQAHSNGMGKLQAKSLEARGEPVTVRSPAEQLHGRCQILEYDLATRRVGLRGTSSDIDFYREDVEIHTRELHYEPAADGRVGRFLASGRGWMRGNVPEEQQSDENPPADMVQREESNRPKQIRQYDVRWGKEMRARPVDQELVISIEKDALIDMPGTGMLAADQIHAWLTETPPDALAQTRADGTRPERLIPNRMLAEGQVRFDSIQLEGATSKLEMWFTQAGGLARGDPGRRPMLDFGRSRREIVAAPPIGRARDRLVLAQFRAPAEQPGAAVAADFVSDEAGDLASRQKFVVAGGLLRVQLRLQGRRPEVTEVVIEGAARFAEIETAAPNEKPMLVEGERLHVVRPRADAATVTVTGQPAHVEGRGVALNGHVINLDQVANRMWIDGGGSMTLLIDKNPSDIGLTALGGATGEGAQPLNVAWRKRMTFDGQQAVFEGTVEAARQEQMLVTEFLEVLLDRRINFAAPRQAAQPKVEVVHCRDGVDVTNRASNEQGLSSIERLQAIDLSINHITGEVLAEGPGWLTRVQRGPPMRAPELPGARRDPDLNAAPGKEGLNYLKVRFQQSLSGNLHRRQMRFADQVHAVYGPVPAWEAKIDPNSSEGLGADGILLTCDQLDVLEMPDAGADGRHVELEAAGNTFVEGQTFTARANRMTYHQLKDMLVLEGSGRASAELSHQKRVGGPVSNLAAGKILYWRSSNRVEVDDAKFLDLGQMRQQAAPRTDRRR